MTQPNGATQPEADNALSALERMLWTQIQQRQGEMAARHELEKQAFTREAQDFFRVVEAQHGLPAGAIGTTHDFRDGRIVEIAVSKEANTQPVESLPIETEQKENVTT